MRERPATPLARPGPRAAAAGAARAAGARQQPKATRPAYGIQGQEVSGLLRERAPAKRARTRPQLGCDSPRTTRREERRAGGASAPSSAGLERARWRARVTCEATSCRRTCERGGACGSARRGAARAASDARARSGRRARRRGRTRGAPQQKSAKCRETERNRDLNEDGTSGVTVIHTPTYLVCPPALCQSSPHNVNTHWLDPYTHADAL